MHEYNLWKRRQNSWAKKKDPKEHGLVAIPVVDYKPSDLNPRDWEPNDEAPSLSKSSDIALTGVTDFSLAPDRLIDHYVSKGFKAWRLKDEDVIDYEGERLRRCCDMMLSIIASSVHDPKTAQETRPLMVRFYSADALIGKICRPSDGDDQFTVAIGKRDLKNACKQVSYGNAKIYLPFS